MIRFGPRLIINTWHLCVFKLEYLLTFSLQHLNLKDSHTSIAEVRHRAQLDYGSCARKWYYY